RRLRSKCLLLSKRWMAPSLYFLLLSKTVSRASLLK
ncbi:efflux transporter, RND family, MFP subunit, partial [Vibrio harveyi]